MKQATHEELVAAKDSEDWDFLWRAAIPLVKVAVRRHLRSNAIQTPKWVREDLLQEGLLAAGAAVRTWQTFDCAFSTWVHTRVQGVLVDASRRAANNGLGSYKQDAVSHTSLQDEARPGRTFADVVPDGRDALFSDDALLDDAISKLRDPVQQSVIRLFMAGYSCAEIGRMHNKSQDWAERRLSAAKKLAAKLLELPITPTSRRSS